MESSTLTERGQISVPASLRKAMQLEPGQKMIWEQLSPVEIRVTLPPAPSPGGPLAALGYARGMRKGKTKTTKEWMKELRAGESAS